MKAKSLGQVAYEAAFTHRRTPKAHNDYPHAWDRVAKAVERDVWRKWRKAAVKGAVQSPAAALTSPAPVVPDQPAEPTHGPVLSVPVDASNAKVF